MALIVMKFGGSSVADTECMVRVAELIAAEYRAGHRVVAVISAQGDTTDILIEKALALNEAPPARELDLLLSTGEQAAAALLAMGLAARGIPAVALTGGQAGIRTDASHGAAHIQGVDTARLLAELEAGRIPVVAGFQGVDPVGGITTLGRGGSDTTAVALAAALRADACRIYTDVDGVYTADPRKDPRAKKLERIGYDEMLAMAQNGAEVLHDRAVLLAKRYGVPLWVLSSFDPRPGTLVGEEPSAIGEDSFKNFNHLS